MKNILRESGFWLCVVAMLFYGCAGKPGPDPAVLPETPPAQTQEEPRGPGFFSEIVLDVPQRASQAVPVSDELIISVPEQAALYERLVERFFAPWQQTGASLSAHDITWGVRSLGSKQGFAENLQPYPQDRWVHVVALQDLPNYPSMSAAAITVRNTALRVLPSSRPFFLNPALPGEGFPFDYFQNTALWLGTPVLVTHTSLDRAWHLVETALASGWVHSEDVALVDPGFRAQYESAALVALRQDETSLVRGGRFYGQTHVGAVFPLHSQSSEGFTVKVPVRGAAGQASIALADLGYHHASLMPVPLTSRAVADLADAMAGQLYGWGGMFENRDCSSTMRDLFLPFGIWLPRNSSQQGRSGGEMVSLEGLDASAKIDLIRARGVPFSSLIWLPGHIGLYIGLDARGEPLLLHNIWGVRTVLPGGGEGRAVAGRLVISTLRPGEERADVRRNAFLDRLLGLTLVGKNPAAAQK